MLHSQTKNATETSSRIAIWAQSSLASPSLAESHVDRRVIESHRATTARIGTIARIQISTSIADSSTSPSSSGRALFRAAADVVIDSHLLPGVPMVGGVLSGSFWLSGRIIARYHQARRSRTGIGGRLPMHASILELGCTERQPYRPHWITIAD